MRFLETFEGAVIVFTFSITHKPWPLGRLILLAEIVTANKLAHCLEPALHSVCLYFLSTTFPNALAHPAYTF